MKLLTQNDLIKIFNISNTAILELVHTGKLPYKSIDGSNILFSSDTIIKYIEKPLNINNEKYIERLKKKLWQINPTAMQAFQEYGSHFPDLKTLKKYYLDKVKSKKLGFVWYVRYLVNGQVVPSHWTIKTNDIKMAEIFAIENRERLLNEYFNRDKVKKSYGELYSILRKYYSDNSPYLQSDADRGRVLGYKARVSYHNFILKQFIPYLRKNIIKNFEEIDTPLLARFRKQLLRGSEEKIGVKPQTIKHYISCISQIFDNLIIEGYIKINPVKSLVSFKTANEKLRGCYEITKLKGVFNKTWKDQFSYLLCLIIYTTGMRNSEIERIKVKDLLTIDNTHFIDITTSKTKNGIRIIPLHDFVYKKLMTYIRKTGKKNTDLIFNNDKRKHLGGGAYEKANSELAEFTKYTVDRLKKENITFYSGRHFWKTLMNSERLGDIEEYFMGHKTSGDVSKRYNHKDKQGKKKLLERSRRAFAILDEYIFR